MSKISLTGNPSGTGVLTIAAPSTNSDRTLTLPDNSGTVVTTGSTASVSQAMLASGVAGTGPTFNVGIGGAQTISATTWTKVQLTVETFDIGSCFDTSTHRFTPNVAGYYQISGNVSMETSSATAVIVALYKNGTPFRRGTRGAANSQSLAVGFSTVVYLNGTTDYVELYIFSSAGNNTESSSEFTWMSGALVRAT